MYLRRAASILVLLCCAVPVQAGEPALTTPPALEVRLQALESRQSEIYHTLAQKKEAGLAEQLTEQLTLSGLLEMEATAGTVGYADGSSDSASDLILASAQLGLGMKLNDSLGGNLIFLFEEGGDLEVDEAAIDLQQGAFFARVGRHYLPFGAYHSHFISDPLTLALGETRATALHLGYKPDLVAFSAFAFNGADATTGSEEHINDWGASVTVFPLAGLELGGSYLSALAASNTALLAGLSTRRVAGWSAFVHLERGPLTLEVEYLTAARAFAVSDLDGNGDGQGDRPRTWNIECALRPAETVEAALRYEGSAEFANQPQRQFGADLSWSPWQHFSVSLEYLHADFAPAFAGGLSSSNGSPAETRDQFTAQLAYAF